MKIPKTTEQMVNGDLGDDLEYVEYVASFHETHANRRRREANEAPTKGAKMIKIADAIASETIAMSIRENLAALEAAKVAEATKTSSPADEPSSKPPVAPAPTVH